MANNVIGQLSGGEKKVFDNVRTVVDIKNKLGASNVVATLNGEAANDCEELSDNDYVFLTPAVKGGLI